MKIHEKYTEALKSFTDYVTVSEWAQRVGEIYPEILEKAEEQAKGQKQNTTGLREIAARISSNLSSGSFKHVAIDESERPRKVKFLTSDEQKVHQKQDFNDDIEPITRLEIINQAKDNFKVLETYRLDEFKSIQKSFKDYFGLDFDLDHAEALLNKDKQGVHHPDNIQLLMKYHNGKKSNKSWERFDYEAQVKYIQDAIRLQSNVANEFDIELDNEILKHLLVRLKAIY